MVDHSAINRLLHRLILESKSVSELLFDVENAFMRSAEPRKSAVYVTGLARCGSTALLRSLHSSGLFACLTYQDMPFVIAPNLWRSVSGSSSVKDAGRERPHGDGIIENRESPEGLEEVFWKKELGHVYIRKDALCVHEVPASIIERLKVYQSLVCARYGSARYLAKNNNLILRIHSLAPQTKDSCYLVLFRQPIDHAGSLLRQHLRFSATSGFSRDYMRWLVHHEFGVDHRPFFFSGGTSRALSPSVLDYWLERWIDAYSYLVRVLKANPDNTVAVQYERLCEDETYRSEVFARVGACSTAATFVIRNRGETGVSKVLVDRANAIYSELCALSNPLPSR